MGHVFLARTFKAAFSAVIQVGNGKSETLLRRSAKASSTCIITGAYLSHGVKTTTLRPPQVLEAFSIMATFCRECCSGSYIETSSQRTSCSPGTVSQSIAAEVAPALRFVC